jgi:hypothetical protein
MEDILKSETPINDNKKKYNAQIISTLMSETCDNYDDSDKDLIQNNHLLKQHQLNLSRDVDYMKYKKNNVEVFQEDIVNIAASIHDLIKMVDEQREKTENLEKQLAKLNLLEDDISKLNLYIQKLEESKESVKNSTESESSIKEIININQRKNILYKKTPPSIKSIMMNKKKENNFSSSNSVVTSTPTLTETSESSCVKPQKILFKSKELEEKLNNITKGFNNEILDMKRKQALLASCSVKKNKTY